MRDCGPSIACFLGAGFSLPAGIPLAKDLLTTKYVLALSQASERRFIALREHYEDWHRHYPSEHAEQYLGALYANTLKGAPPWKWAVEYISAVIASAGIPPTSLNHNPRYSNRINRPAKCGIHQRFWNTILNHASRVVALTTNYDVLIERMLRHRPMQRPSSPGCFYGGIPRPQQLKGAAQPFSVFASARVIEMSGAIPVFKLHGSLNWSLSDGNLLIYQDARAAFRDGGNAAIVPPIPEKSVPGWLRTIWDESESALQNSDVWVICGYSAPTYDSEVLELLRKGSIGRCRHIFLLSPDSESLSTRWNQLAPEARVVALQGLPGGIDSLAENLNAVQKMTAPATPRTSATQIVGKA